MGYTDLATIKLQAMEEAERLIGNLNRKSSHSFRNRYDHTLRVLNWADRIQKVEGGDPEIIAFAVLFHDTGWSDKVNHALVGAELAEKFLRGKGVDPDLVERISSAVRTHNNRWEPQNDLPIENLVVMDADFLDEVGVTTLVWDSLAAASEDKPGYLKVLERDLKFYKSSKEKVTFLRTETGLKLYKERLEIWEGCINQLKYELGVSDDFGT